MSARQAPRLAAHIRAVQHLETKLVSGSSLLALANIAATHLIEVFPLVQTLIAGQGERAAQIPDPHLRACAQRALHKRGNIEGAALFAVLAPRRNRHETVRALVALQGAYNYLDELTDQPAYGADPAANAATLHEALLVALDPSRPHPDYYLHSPHREDGSYLARTVDECRVALDALPSMTAVKDAAQRAAGRIIAFQSLNLSDQDGGHEHLKAWAANQPEASILHWYELAAAAGSSIPLHALIALAARPILPLGEIRLTERGYHPEAAALHTLLDSLVDIEEDLLAGRESLLSHYQPHRTAPRLALLATQATASLNRLSNPARHRAILAAMASYYLTDPQLEHPEARPVTRALTATLGTPLLIARGLFAARRRVGTLSHNIYR